MFFKCDARFLREEGYRVLEPKVSYMGHVHQRAKQLQQQIHDWSERDHNEKVILLSHSLGGLDARWLVSPGSGLDDEALVQSVVTIATPHRGTITADIARIGVTPLKFFTDGLVNYSLQGVHCLTTDFVRNDFNSKCVDSPHVSYFSVAGEKGSVISNYSPILRLPHVILYLTEGPNDGMVSVQSAKWGHFLGTFPVDHLDQIRNINASRNM